MFLDDLFEHRRIARRVPHALGIDDGDRSALADAQAVGFRSENAALLGEAELLQPALEEFPRRETALFLVRRHANVNVEVSGIPPKSLPRYFPRLPDVADKVVWGTDWPSPGITSPKKNVEEFRALGFTDDVQRKILYDNAVRLFA